MTGQPERVESTRRATGTRSRRTLHAQTLELGPQLAAALDGVREPLAIVDRTGRVVMLNRAFEAWVGCDAQRVLGEPLQGLLRGAQGADWLAEQAKRSETFRVRVHVGVDDVAAQVELRPLLDDSGVLTHFCVSAEDLPDDLPHPEATTQTNALATMGRLAAELAHDINNQLAVVLNYGFVLRRQLDTSLHEHMDELQAAAWRASEVAHRLLGFGRRPLAEAALLQLDDTLRELQPLLSHVLQGAALELHIEPDLPSTALVPSQAEQLLMGVCLELRELVGPGGRARISLTSVQLVPGPETPEALSPGRYLLLVAAGSAGKHARGETLLPARRNTGESDGSITLTRLTRQLRGHLAIASSSPEPALRVLLPVRDF